MRLFVAIALDEDSAKEFAQARKRLERREDGLRWTPAGCWHVTLQFLGETDAPHMACVVEALQTVRAEPAVVEMEGLGMFARAGVLFAGVRPAAELAALERRVTAATARCGFAREERVFHPHITLARRKGRTSADALRALEARVGSFQMRARFVAREFCLYESFLGAGGARYEVRERFQLGGAG